MSHDDHKTTGKATLVEKFGVEFGDNTVDQLLEKALRARVTGLGNTLEANFIIDTTHGKFQVHFHLCLNATAGQCHIKH